MKQALINIIFIMLLTASAAAQSLVGMSKEDVSVYVKKEHKEFRRDASVIKQHFNYLKFVNGVRTKTWIIYFNDDDICKTSKLVCDYSELDEVLNATREKYGEALDNVWEYISYGDTIQVELIRQEWYFTIRESRKK